MPTAATLLMIAAALGASEPAIEASTDDLTPIQDPIDAQEDATEGSPAAMGTGAGDPLYDRLFAQADEAMEPTASASSLPPLPPWLWVLGLASLGGLAATRLRQRKVAPEQGQVEVLGHTRMGAKARLTVIRVAGEDGRMRRLLVSTGDGTPSLVADLGTEADPAETELNVLASTTAPTSPPRASRPDDFGVALQRAVALEGDIIDDDATDLPEGVGLGEVPPPRVPVWNEPPGPQEATPVPPTTGPTAAARPSAVTTHSPAPPPPTPSTPVARPVSTLERLESLLDEEDAPEMVMEVTWDSERGWRGLPELEPATDTPAPSPEASLASALTAHGFSDGVTSDDEEPQWDELLEEHRAAPDPLVRAGVRPASRAAFEALLSGSGRQPAEINRGKRVRPAIQTVKPLRPGQPAPARRTPYDAVIADEEDTTETVTQLPLRPRSAREVHDLVAEVLNERVGDDNPAASSPRGNGVVELARYLRRQVSP